MPAPDISFQTINGARLGLYVRGYKPKAVAKNPGEYCEEVIDNRIYVSVLFWNGTGVIWAYDRITELFKRIEQ